MSVARCGAAVVLAAALTACAASTAQPPGEERWWRGNLHTHSLWSDGDEFPEMIAAWYREHGYHFVALTEHDMLQEGERWLDVLAPDDGWPPRNESARRALPAYCARFGDVIEERQEGTRHLVRLRRLDEYRARFERAGEFLLVPGVEITDREGAHVNAINPDIALRPLGGDGPAARIRANLAQIRERRARTGRALIGIVNHPNFLWALTAEEIAAIEDARLFEVYNGHTMVNNAGDSLRASTDVLWDVALALRHEAGLPPLYGVATDDAHSYRVDSDSVSRAGRGWVMVRAARLEPDEIVGALERGDFYATTGVTLASLDRDSDGIRVAIDGVPGATYRTRFIGTRLATPLVGEAVVDEHGDPLRTTRRYADVGVVLAEVEGVTAAYRFTGDERYVRAVVVSDRPHVDPTTGVVLGRQRAWIQPVFRNDR